MRLLAQFTTQCGAYCRTCAVGGHEGVIVRRVLLTVAAILMLMTVIITRSGNRAEAIEVAAVPTYQPAAERAEAGFPTGSGVATSGDLFTRTRSDNTQTIYRVADDGSIDVVDDLERPGVIGGGWLVDSMLNHYRLGNDGTLTLVHELNAPAGAIFFDGTSALSITEESIRFTTLEGDATPSITTFPNPGGDALFPIAAIGDGIAALGLDNAVHTWRLEGGVWTDAGRLAHEPEETALGERPGHQWPRSVAVDGNTVFAGADIADVSPDFARVGPGAVLVWEHSGDDWVRQDTIRGFDQRPGSIFGRSIAADDGVLAVSSFDYRNNVDGNGTTRSVHVYRQRGDGTWDAVAKLLGIDANLLSLTVADDGRFVVANSSAGFWLYDGPFQEASARIRNVCADPLGDCAAGRLLAPAMRGEGAAVTLSEGRLVTNNRYASDDWLWQGSVEVWDVELAFDGSVSRRRITGPNPIPGGFLGYGADVEADLLAMTGNSPGAKPLHVYRGGEDGRWRREATLSTPGLGTPIVHEGQVLVFGSGRLTVFEERNGAWTQVQSRSVDGTPSYLQGDSAMIEGDLWKRGAAGTWAPSNDPRPISDAARASDTLVHDGDLVAFEADGSVRIERLVDGEWTLESTLAAAADSPWDTFGQRLAIDGDRLLIGESTSFVVTGGLTPRELRGVVHLYEHADGVWTRTRTFTDTRAVPEGRYDFGASFDVDGDTVAIARGDGATYLHRLAETPVECMWTFRNELDTEVKLKKLIDGRDRTQETVQPGESAGVPVDAGDRWTVRRADDFSRVFREAVPADCMARTIVIADEEPPPGACTLTITNGYPDELKVKLAIDGRESTQHRLAAGETRAVAVEPGETWLVRQTSTRQRLWRETIADPCVNSDLTIAPVAGFCEWTFINEADFDVKVKEVVDGREVTRLRVNAGTIGTIRLDQQLEMVLRNPADASRVGEFVTPIECRSPTITISNP